jgi:plasmid stability protein
MTLEIQNLSDTTVRLLQAEASRHNTDVESLAKELILQGIRQRIESEPWFDVFSGLWSAEDATEFAAATAHFSKVDKEVWRGPIQQPFRSRKRDLSHLAGTWTEEETKAFEESSA